MIDTAPIKGNGFGLHLTYDAYGCPYDVLTKMDLVYEAMDKLAAALEMQKLSAPYVVEAAANGKKDPGGFTGFLIIAESHISIHTFGKRGFVSADVYSCTYFDTDKTVSLLNEIFHPQSVETCVIERGKNYPDKDLY